MVAPAPPPPTNRLTLIPGATALFTVDLVGRDGYPLHARRLERAVAQVLVRTDPGGSNILAFTSADPAHVVVNAHASSITVNFLVADIAVLTVGAIYFWQLELDLCDGEILVPVNWTLIDVTLGGSASPPPPTFPSTVAITQDYPLPGDLLYQTPGGCGIEGAQIRVYLLSDYQAGNFASPVGTSMTGRGGKWTNPVLVSPGFTYIAQFVAPYSFGPDVSPPFFA